MQGAFIIHNDYAGRIQIQIVDLLGVTITESSMTGQAATIDANYLAAGSIRCSTATKEDKY